VCLPGRRVARLDRMILSVSDLVKLQAPASRGAARASELLPIHGPTTTTAAARDRARRAAALRNKIYS